MPSFDIDINFNLNNDGIIEAQEALQELTNSAEELNETTESMGSGGLEEAANGANQTNENIKEASESMKEFGNNTDEANQKMQETAESSAGLGTALAGVAGAVGLDAMIQTGDNIQTSWNRLSLTFDGTGVSMDTLKSKSSQLNAETGRSGGQIREYFNQMGIAGVTNTDLLASSFSALSGRAYQTGNSIDTMGGMVNRMVMTGNAGSRMLTNLGLKTSDLASAMGVTEDQVKDTFAAMSQEERLEAITKAMGDGTEANEMYKNSYAGLKEQAQASLAGLMGAIGQSILPVVIPALNAAKGAVNGLTSVWKGLPAPLQQVFGVFGGGIVAITTAVGALGTLGKVGSSVVGGLKSVRDGYKAMKDAIGTAKVAVDALRNAESISQGIRAAISIVTGAETTAEGANAAAKSAAIAPTTGLAIAENSLLLPLLLLVGAIIAVVAVLWYLYNNNETVRQSIDGLLAQFWNFINILINVGQQIYTFVANAVTQVWQWVNGTTNGVNNLVNLVMSILFPFPTMILNILNRVLPVIISAVNRWISSATSGASNLINNVSNTLSGMPSRVASAVSGVSNAIAKPFQDAYNSVAREVERIKNKANELSGGLLGGLFGGIEYAGFNSVGYEGFDNTLNSTIASSSNNNSSTINNNFNINGIIEEEASQFIVSSVNEHIKKQNLIRGV